MSPACVKPEDLGYAAELWTRSALAKHVRNCAVEAGHPSLAKATVQRILAKQFRHPERVKYYLERRDPRFEEKMKNVLLVYKAVSLQNEGGGQGVSAPPTITVSIREKPGLQAIGNTAPDLPPVAGKHPEVARDHEYQRAPSWRRWICMAATSRHASSTVIGASNLSRGSKTWTATIRRSAASV